MTRDELKDWLHSWGRWYGERPSRDWDDSQAPSPYTTGQHPIAAAMQHAPRTRGEAIRLKTTMDRGGLGRRSMMAAAANAGLTENRTTGIKVVPGAFVDPVRARETRRSVYAMGEISRPPPVAVQRIERHALDLHALDVELGVCLRVRYCTIGQDADKASIATERLRDHLVLPPEGVLSVNAFRDGVAEARTWMWGRLSAPDGLTPR